LFSRPQQGTQRQQYGRQELIHPGPQPQRPVRPLQAAFLKGVL